LFILITYISMRNLNNLE